MTVPTEDPRAGREALRALFEGGKLRLVPMGEHYIAHGALMPIGWMLAENADGGSSGVEPPSLDSQHSGGRI